ncbi:aminopeptidase [Desulfovibrio sulfodismutans]|uniref:M18 family aminopeptidase n=1 Tax=Desulfolutivibrio sulfodismutans TaxID=63561 RepID=A0A7K3NP46_9BACT|nr:aminopeptidase [Desulfolutivibrio sulfodismutans]NDY57964.1 aminopeptidase [Desulfolutivibrio sulfodismutans]QLA14102.1 aminopeptidase [Desulfolutivibrio sulfodismutans DSM 3696]
MIELEFETKNCWDVYTDKKSKTAMEKLAVGYMDFLSRCKTERETVEFVRGALRMAGFMESAAGDFKGDAVFRVAKGKTLFAARKGKRPLSAGFRLVGAHADTPRLDLKQRPLYQECAVAQAKTHYYGGIRKHQWLARPLALHGVVVKKDGTVVPVCIGEEASDPVFAISDLLPHLAYKQADKKLSDAFEAEKLNIILGHSPAEEGKKPAKDKGDGKSPIKHKVLTLLNARYGITEEDLYSAELQAVPAGAARRVGLDGGIIGGFGQDDRICVYAGLMALLAAPRPEHTQVVLFWDKEEIGSEGSTGAKSHFFEYCLEDLVAGWEPRAKPRRIYEKSKALSADVHAAMDPDYQDLHEKLNAALLGYGPCFCKFTGHRGKVGANDAHPEYVAWLRGVLAKAGVPWQMAELGKVDHGGGGTVAKFLAVYGMDVIDFGPPVLSMHSPFELSSVADLYATMLAYKAFLQS